MPASTTPLLQGGAGEGGAAGEEEKTGDVWWRKGLERVVDVEEAKAQLVLAFPMILSNISFYGITLVSVMFAGHLGDLELAGATLGNSWCAVTGLALMIGLSGSLETLCGQGYGAKLYRMLGLYLQSSMAISLIFSFIVSFLWYYSETILIWLHQDPEISKMAGVYLIYLIPGIFAFGFLQCLLRFLQTQSVVMPMVVCSVVPLALHLALTYSTIYIFGFGFKGASFSGSISLWISFLMLAAYVNYSGKFQSTWQGFSAESFQHIIPSLRLALPSAIMVCLEYWAFEILVLLAGLLPESELSTSVIAMCVNTEAIAYMTTYGLSAVVSTRVSNEIGAGNIEKAKRAVSVTLKLSVLLALVIILLLAFGHNLWAGLFSSSDSIIREFAYMTPLLMVSIVLDSAQGVLSGVARGCGWQHLAAWTNLFTFYLIGMPLAVLFSFKLALDTKGLWLGLICGLSCQAGTLLLITLRIKWSRVDLQLESKPNDTLA